MRLKFLSWLFLLICAAFAVAGMLAYTQFQRQAHDRATQIMSTRLSDLLELITYTQASMKHVMEINDASTLERARALAEIIRLDPSVLQSQEALQGLCNDLGCNELNITDEHGAVIASVPSSNKGYKMDGHEQSRPFMRCIAEPGFELSQRLPQGATDGIRQYAGVSRLDQPGIVQLGIASRHEQTVRASSSFGKLAANFRLGKRGHIIAFRDGALLNQGQFSFPTADLLALPLDKPSSIDISDEEYFTYAVGKDGFRLVGLLPRSEMTEMSRQNLWRLLRSNVFLFIVEFILVWILLQRMVLSGLSRIVNSLRRITEGFKDERVDVKSCPEFLRLSTGINNMVDSLQNYAEQSKQRMQRELELARSIQSTVLPNEYPAFPNHPEFDIYATCTQAHELGGDFYDFFMPDSQHLCFLVGDISAQGVPAALFMMRAISTIRGIAFATRDVEELVKKANASLCEGSTPGMRLSLFYGILHIASGQLNFVNAGKPQALLQHEKAEFERISMNSGPAMGYLPDASYTACTLTLEPGDRLFLYTDGVLEATNADNTPFDILRLQKALQQDAPAISDVPRNVYTALRTFTSESEPNRDITMLAFEYRGKKRNRASISFPAGEPGNMDTLLDEQLESVFAAPPAIQDIHSSLHCILGKLPPDCAIALNIRCDEEEAEISLHYGMPLFNPLVSLPHLPLDHTEFHADPATGSTLKLWKKLE